MVEAWLGRKRALDLGLLPEGYRVTEEYHNDFTEDAHPNAKELTPPQQS